MPWPLRLFTILPLAVLAGRVVLSRDPRWQRVAAALFILAALVAQAVLLPLVASREPWSPGYRALELLQAAALFGGGLVLLVWAFASRDPAWQRILSGAVGLFGLGPVIIALAGAAPAMFASAHEGAN
jgi:hypothetical protein